MPDFRLSEGAQTNPASLPLSGNELVFFSQEINGVWTTVVAKAKAIADLGMTQAQVDALVTMIGQRAPAVHQHSASDINAGVFAQERIPSLPISKITSLTTQLGEKAASVHTHQITEIVGLRQELDALWGGGGGGGGITLPIQITDVSGLRFELDDLGLAVGNKADRVHPHDAGDIATGTLNKARLPELLIADVTGLQDALDSAADGGAQIDDGAVAANKVFSSQKVSDLLAGKRDAATNIQTTASAASVTPSFANDVVEVTALAVAASIANPTGTAADGRMMLIRIKDNGTARTLTWGTAYVSSGAALPTTTVAGKWLNVLCVRNNTAGQMQVIASGVEGTSGDATPVVDITGASATLSLSHAGCFVRCNNASAQTITIPPQSAVAWPDNAQIEGAQWGAGAVTFTQGAGVTIRKKTNRSATTDGQYAPFGLKRVGLNEWFLFGDLGTS